jgi:hypothetical protein
MVMLFVAPTAGCSIVFVDSPKRDPQTRIVSCTDTYTWPAVDTGLALLQVARTLYALTRSDADYQGAAIPRDADIAIGIGLTGLFGGSAGYGYSVVGACHREYDLDREHLSVPAPRRRIVRPPAPRSLPPAAAPANPEPPTIPPPEPQAGIPEPPAPSASASVPQRRDSE